MSLYLRSQLLLFLPSIVLLQHLTNKDSEPGLTFSVALQAEKLESIGPLGDVPALPAPPQDRSRSGLEMELVDGKLVPKAQSLVIQAQAAPLFQEVTEYSNVVNNASYMHKAICDRWRPEETEMFFQVDPSIVSRSPEVLFA